MAEYVVVGAHVVNGAAPGETLEIEDGDRAAYLMSAGHVAVAGDQGTQPSMPDEGLESE